VKVRQATAVVLLLATVHGATAQPLEFYVATPRKASAELWDSAFHAALCFIDRTALYLNRRPMPVGSCQQGLIAELEHGTKVREILPPGECRDRQTPMKRVRVLTGAHQGKVGCLVEGVVATEPLD
jgi:hypothetical protein